MLELGAGADILRGLGWLYIGLGVVVVTAALLIPRRWWQKLTGVVVVLLVFTGPAYLRNRERTQLVDERKARFESAEALFVERCKSAGEKINRVVKGVDGILLKIRPQSSESDQFILDDPYGRNCAGDSCAALYLFDYKMVPGPGRDSGLVPSTPRLYRYVDAIDPNNGERFRYTKDTANAKLLKNPIPTSTAQFEVIWDDISTTTDREHWIAGGSLKIIERATGEVIAERRGYLMDPGQGATTGGRTPWAWARSYFKGCPPMRDHNQAFVLRVLEP